MRFELRARDGLARACTLETPHGKVETPALLPVINPNLQEVPASELSAAFGFRAVITNAYIIRRSEELRARAVKGGVHGLLGFDGPVMTDSGTFQQHVYGDVGVTNAETVAFQMEIGSDIVTPLDVFTEPDEPIAKARAEWETTLSRYREAFALPNPAGALLAATVQGGSHLEVRRASAGAMGGLPDCVHPIGGVVPIMEGGRYALLAEVIAAAKAELPPGRPVHLFGAGHPLVIPLAVALGCDLFDSSSYAKYAKDGRMMFPDGTRALKDLAEFPCACPVCASTTPLELARADERSRFAALARHNLHVLAAEVRRARQAIHEESVWELLEERAHANPKMLEAVRALARHRELLEAAEPLSRARAARYFDGASAVRPLVGRTRQRVLARAGPFAGAVGAPAPAVVVATPKGTPYARRLPPGLAGARRALQVPVVFETVWGPVPEALDEAYPFAQCVAPSTLDPESAARVAGAMEDFFRKHAGTRFIAYEDARLPEIEVAFRPPGVEALQRALSRVRATFAYQFGPEAVGALEAAEWLVERSPRTGKIRRVGLDGEVAMSMRAHDGLFTLTLSGARRLAAAVPAPRHRVVVAQETAPFNAEGRSVFARFVRAMDPELSPGDEALVVDERGALVAVGQVLLTAREAASFKHGVAVRVREGARGTPPK
jgi:7-cyano-7-deazaguanine tRNA-ribosyltransferase